MKKTAVLGVVGSGRINQCVECLKQGVADGEACGGFGPGCFLPHAARPAGKAEEERVVFHPEKLKPDKPL